MVAVRSRQMIFLLGCAVLAAGLRQFAPHALPWKGSWPSVGASAFESYKTFAKPGDPPFIPVEQAVEEHQKKSSTFLDARSPSEYAQGHIPGARNFPFYEMDKYQDGALKGLDENSSIIVYCEGIGCELSFLLGRELHSAGYKNVRIFYGGYPEWVSSGQSIEK